MTTTTITGIRVTGDSDSSDGCGCHAARVAHGHDSFISLLMLFGLGGLLMLSRRRFTLFGALVVSGLMLGSTASVQAQPVSGTNYQMTRSSITYTDLTNPTVLWTGRADENTSVLIRSSRPKNRRVGQISIGDRATGHLIVRARDWLSLNACRAS